MKIYWRCGCGLDNYTWEDWIAHYKYGRVRWQWISLLLKTRPRIER